MGEVKVALVTGGTRGIGRAEALSLAKHGYAVCVCSRRCVPETMEQLEEHAPDVLFVRADMTRPDDVRNLRRKVIERFGHVDVLVNNAGGSRPWAKPLLDTTDPDWHGMMSANLSSAFYCIREFGRVMGAQGHGFIVNTSSVHGLSGGRNGLGAYAATKAALIGLTRAAGKELGGKGVAVIAIAPGLVATDRLVKQTETPVAKLATETPLGRAVTPEEVANVVTSLVGSGALSLNGCLVEISGGRNDYWISEET